MKAPAACLALALGGLLGSCGTQVSRRGPQDAGESGAQRVFARLCLESEGRSLLSLNAAGDASLGTACGTAKAAQPGDTHAFEFSPESTPLLSVDGFALGLVDSGNSHRATGFDQDPAPTLPLWGPLPAMGHALLDVPKYAPSAGGACDVRPELNVLAELLGAEPVGDPGSPRRGESPCRTRELLRCYVQVWKAPTGVNGKSFADFWREGEGGDGVEEDQERAAPTEAKTLRAFFLAQAAQKASTCAGGTADVNGASPTPAAASFIVTDTSLLFTPSPLFSISIYEGALNSYDDALVGQTPAAVVSVPETCGEESKRCVLSPWPVSKCQHCAKLRVGVTYTAFLLEGTGQRHADVKRVTFRR